MSFSRMVLDAIDWTATEVMQGSGTDLKNAIATFLEAGTSEQAAELWWGLEGSAFAQNTLYGAAEPTVDVMMAALADQPPGHLRVWILEVLRFILTGASEDDPELAGRCKAAAMRGAWMLAVEARRTEEEAERQAILEVLDHIDSKFSPLLRGVGGGLP